MSLLRQPTCSCLTDVKFGLMKNLKSLTFVGVLGEGELAFARWEHSIGLMVQHLKNPLFAKSLEVFAIGVEHSRRLLRWYFDFCSVQHQLVDSAGHYA